RAYGIEVVGVQGISTETEAAVADIRRVADLVVDRAVPAVFIESTINPRTLQAVIDGVGQRGGSVRLGAQLYADSLGAHDQPVGTYVGMLVHDVAAITVELGGTVPGLPASASEWLAAWYPDGDVTLFLAQGEEGGHGWIPEVPRQRRAALGDGDARSPRPLPHTEGAARRLVAG